MQPKSKAGPNLFEAIGVFVIALGSVWLVFDYFGWWSHYSAVAGFIAIGLSCVWLVRRNKPLQDAQRAEDAKARAQGLVPRYGIDRDGQYGQVGYETREEQRTRYVADRARAAAFNKAHPWARYIGWLIFIGGPLLFVAYVFWPALAH